MQTRSTSKSWERKLTVCSIIESSKILRSSRIAIRSKICCQLIQKREFKLSFRMLIPSHRNNTILIIWATWIMAMRRVIEPRGSSTRQWQTLQRTPTITSIWGEFILSGTNICRRSIRTTKTERDDRALNKRDFLRTVSPWRKRN